MYNIPFWFFQIWRWNIIKKTSYVIVLFIYIASIFSILTPISLASTSSRLADKDSYVDSYYPNSNYGGVNWLIFGDYLLGPAEAYINFDTYSPPAGWTKAEIQINMYNISETTNLTISVVNVGWMEFSITWSTKPLVAQQITTLTVSTEQIYTIDVTNFISGSNLIIHIAASNLPTGHVYATSKQGHTGQASQGPTLVWTHPAAEASIPGYSLFVLVCIMIGACTYIIKRMKIYT